MSEQHRTCVRCGKPLPGTSKMTEEKVPMAEAQQHGWPGRPGVDDQMIVAMCLQCQIDRAEIKKRPAS